MKDFADNSVSKGGVSANGDRKINRKVWAWVRKVFKARNDVDLRDTLEELIEQEEIGEPPAPKNEIALLRNILHLHVLTVYDVMVPRADIIAVHSEISLSELVRIMSEKAHSRIPVYEETLDNIIGMVHIKDVLACWNSAEKVNLRRIAHSVLFVAPSMPILELLLQMRVSRRHLALVIDEFGGVDGMVTIEDLVEEIVGEIEDEHDEDEKPLLTNPLDGKMEADARVSIKEFEDNVGEVLSSEEREEDFDTLGGFVTFLAGRVPVTGEVVRHQSGIEFEIVEADPRRIRRMRIFSPPNFTSSSE